MLSTRNKVKPEFSMSSMTDIVFLLLIFFMLTSNFVVSNGITLNLPSAKGQVVSDKTVTVSITKDLKYYINDKPVGLSALDARLRKELADMATPTVILNADQAVTLEELVKVMSIIKEMNAKMVLATRPKDQ
jgi:biopolymer transport protein ExbD